MSATKPAHEMKKTLIVAKAVIQHTDGNILLIRRSKTDPRRPLQWDLPGGWVNDEEEDYISAVAREVEEETAIELSHNKFQLVYTFAAKN